jgi:predicted TIM-barrel fold metal-dependent hydrolase
MIVDAHVHFWDPAARHHDWLAEHPRLQRRFGPEDLHAGHHELSGAVVVQADCREEEARDEVRWFTALAAEHPTVLGIVAYAPLHAGVKARAAVRTLAAEPLVVGVRRLLQGEPPALLRSPELAEGIRLLATAGMPFDVCVTHEQLPAVADLAAACPGVLLVLDHLGKPPARSGALDPWRADMARIASYPNVACKLSGLTTEAGPGWTEAGVRPYLDHALEVFGPGRCLVGSDWPVASLTTSVERWLDLVLAVLEGTSDAERAAVLRDNARAMYGLSA